MMSQRRLDQHWRHPEGEKEGQSALPDQRVRPHDRRQLRRLAAISSLHRRSSTSSLNSRKTSSARRTRRGGTDLGKNAPDVLRIAALVELAAAASGVTAVPRADGTSTGRRV
jgi:hypothetical protein